MPERPSGVQKSVGTWFRRVLAQFKYCPVENVNLGSSRQQLGLRRLPTPLLTAPSRNILTYLLTYLLTYPREHLICTRCAGSATRRESSLAARRMRLYVHFRFVARKWRIQTGSGVFVAGGRECVVDRTQAMTNPR